MKCRALLSAIGQVVFSFLAIATACPPSMATTWHVDPNDSAAVATIRGGIAEALTGDTLVIAPTLYFEDSLHVDKNITLLGLTGDRTERPTIDGSGTGCILGL